MTVAAEAVTGRAPGTRPASGGGARARRGAPAG